MRLLARWSQIRDRIICRWPLPRQSKNSSVVGFHRAGLNRSTRRIRAKKQSTFRELKYESEIIVVRLSGAIKCNLLCIMNYDAVEPSLGRFASEINLSTVSRIGRSRREPLTELQLKLVHWRDVRFCNFFFFGFIFAVYGTYLPESLLIDSYPKQHFRSFYECWPTCFVDAAVSSVVYFLRKDKTWEKICLYFYTTYVFGYWS